MDGADEQEKKNDAVKTANNMGDQGSAEFMSEEDGAPVLASRPEMGPSCNLKSILSDGETS